MHKDDNIPLVDENASLEQALIEMSEKALGVTGVVNTENELVGIFTDGDLRRALTSSSFTKDQAIREFMTVDPYCPLVKNTDGKIVGALNMQDLLRAGIV